MEIRPIRPEESEELGRVTVRAYRELFGGRSLGSYEKELLDVETRRLDSEVYVALDENETLMGGVTYVPDQKRSMSEFDDPVGAGIRMLAVDPRFQGRGVGRALIDACVDRARDQGRHRIFLHSTPAMVVARAMYERAGFERAPDLDEIVNEEPGGGDPLHLIAYTLTL